MALSFWGWEGDQRDTAAVLKPSPTDKNIMPYELEDYSVSEAGLKAVVRYAGDLDLLKRLIAAGFPVMLEKGLDHKDGWVGHYQLLAGYDDGQGHFNAYDSLNGDFTGGKTLVVPYETVETHWLAFNYTYIVIFPAERENEVFKILGSDQDETSNLYKAADKASINIFNSSGRELFFAWYNRGTNLMRLTDYGGSAQAYDEAFSVYASLDPDDRPWRILWYQTGPYFAYYFTGRYYDVINLANQTLDLMPDPVLEESFYWRGLAKEALGDIDGAIQDLKTSLIHHPDFEPSLYQLNRLGAST
jgi:tetratricopeptide (TPR) repeat protein